MSLRASLQNSEFWLGDAGNIHRFGGLVCT